MFLLRQHLSPLYIVLPFQILRASNSSFGRMLRGAFRRHGTCIPRMRISKPVVFTAYPLAFGVLLPESRMTDLRISHVESHSLCLTWVLDIEKFQRGPKWEIWGNSSDSAETRESVVPKWETSRPVGILPKFKLLIFPTFLPYRRRYRGLTVDPRGIPSFAGHERESPRTSLPMLTVSVGHGKISRRVKM